MVVFLKVSFRLDFAHTQSSGAFPISIQAEWGEDFLNIPINPRAALETRVIVGPVEVLCADSECPVFLVVSILIARTAN